MKRQFRLEPIGRPPEQGGGGADYVDPEPFRVELGASALTFYPAGADRLDALLDLIVKARQSLCLFYYMFQKDEAGQVVRTALLEAAERGVEVELIIDSFGSDREEAFFRPLEEAGARFSVFMARPGTRYLIRNHQKLAIADDTVALIGGFNISNHYFAPPEENGWNDLGVKVEGEAVQPLRRWFTRLSWWTRDKRENFRAIRRLVREWDPGEGPVQLVLGGPTRVPSSWAMRIKQDLARGTRLDMVMAYFSPPRSYLRVIRQLADRGHARLVLAGQSDNRVTIAAARSMLRKLLQHGAEVHEFQPCKLHTKLIVVDDVTYIGSANFDMRSLRLNLELMLRVEDKALAARMRDYIDGFVPHSCHITMEDYRGKAGWWHRLRWWAGWLIVSVLDYSLARGLTMRG